MSSCVEVSFKNTTTAIINFSYLPLNLFTDSLVKTVSKQLSYLESLPKIAEIILYGGDKIFSAGVGLSNIDLLRDSNFMQDLAVERMRLITKIANSPKHITAIACGFANGFGFDIFQTSNTRIASDSAKFSFYDYDLERNILYSYLNSSDKPPYYTNISNLDWEKITSGKTFTAQELQTFGLVDKLVPVDNILEVSH